MLCVLFCNTILCTCYFRNILKNVQSDRDTVLCVCYFAIFKINSVSLCTQTNAMRCYFIIQCYVDAILKIVNTFVYRQIKCSDLLSNDNYVYLRLLNRFNIIKIDT